MAKYDRRAKETKRRAVQHLGFDAEVEELIADFLEHVRPCLHSLSSAIMSTSESLVYFYCTAHPGGDFLMRR